MRVASTKGPHVEQYASVITPLRIIAENIFALKRPIKLPDSGPKLPGFGRLEILECPSLDITKVLHFYVRLQPKCVR